MGKFSNPSTKTLVAETRLTLTRLCISFCPCDTQRYVPLWSQNTHPYHILLCNHNQHLWEKNMLLKLNAIIYGYMKFPQCNSWVGFPEILCHYLIMLSLTQGGTFLKIRSPTICQILLTSINNQTKTQWMSGLSTKQKSFFKLAPLKILTWISVFRNCQFYLHNLGAGDNIRPQID